MRCGIDFLQKCNNPFGVQMNFPFNAAKAAEAAMLFLQLEKKEPTVLKLVKLMYLVERESLERRDVPLFGGHYFSLKHGPVTSEPYNLMKGEGAEADQQKWDELISERDGNVLRIKKLVEPDFLSKAEVRLINEVHARHADKRAMELRDWCHDNVPEYEEVTCGNRPIRLGRIASAVGANSKITKEEMQTSLFFSNVFSS